MKHFLSFPLAFAALLGIGVSEGSNCPRIQGRIVKTSSGPVKGHASATNPKVSEYLGIRYGHAPVGDLRFAPPAKYTSDQLYDASNWSPICPQPPGKAVDFPNATDVMPNIIANFAGQIPKPQSEDCLKLNVWSKDSGATKKPVLIWIHGGRFAAGSTDNLFYQGQYLAEQEDIVVVTVNYRLNVFGFSGAPGVTPNAALLDQRMAVEWVRDNIEGFGGDPSRITFFGHSAGGVSVDYYTFAYKADPIVNGVISMSGTALSMKPNTPEESQKYWYTLSEALGCGGSGDVLACVRSKPQEDVAAAVAKVPAAPTKALAQPVFHPTVDNTIVFSDYELRAAKGDFVKVPYMAGNGNYEAGYYKYSAFAAGVELTERQWHLFNAAGFDCSSGREVTNRLNNGVPSWRYRYNGEWPNSIMYPGSGSYHGADVSQVFGTAEDVSGAPNTEPEVEVSRYMMRAWAAFAADPKNGLLNLGWPKYNPKAPTVVQLAENNNPKPRFASPSEFDELCAEIGTDTSYAQGGF